MWGDVDLCKLGGVTDSEKCTKIAEALFGKEELKRICIDPKRKPQARQPADPERTELYRRACKISMGGNFSEQRYRYILSLVNQKGSNEKGKPTNEDESPLVVPDIRSLDKENFQHEAVESFSGIHLAPAMIQNAQPSNFVHPENFEPETVKSVPANPVTPVAKVSTRGARKTQGQNK